MFRFTALKEHLIYDSSLGIFTKTRDVMLTEAYIMIKSDLGAEYDILKEIENIPEVKEAYQVHGIYNIIVRIATGKPNELKQVVEQKIRKIQMVRSTLSMVIIDATDGDEQHKPESKGSEMRIEFD